MKIYFPLLAVMLFTFSMHAQSLYDMDQVQTISITFAESNWDALLDAQKAGDEDYIMAQSVEINGILYDSVGVKYKGNSTYNANQTKNPFHIELDTYKDHDHEGYTDLKLSNMSKDPSCIREVLAYDILGNYMIAPQSNFANVYVNGDLLGVYSNVESISKKFVKKHFNSKTNTFVKCSPPDGAGPGSSAIPNLVYLGQDSALYYDAYELKSDYGWDDLIALCQTLNEDVDNIESILDVDRAIWMLVFDIAIVNLDSYIGAFGQNYYLYQNDHGRFLPVVWDLNESFGTFSRTASGTYRTTQQKQEMSHLLQINDANVPLMSKLLNVPTYKKMYLAHLKTFITENFQVDGSYYALAQQLNATVDASVQADQNKFYTYANFIANLTSDISAGGGPGGGNTTPGITNLMNGRYTYLMSQTEFTATQPSIASVEVSNDAPVVGDAVFITASVQDHDNVYLRHRDETGAAFSKIEMIDDGAHGDGAAGDGVYGASIDLDNIETQYYIYAENETIGKFSPTNAEHEFYTIKASSLFTGDVVINEFMASNDTTVADQDGDFDDWVELYNNSTDAVDISGYQLADDASELTQFIFPDGTIMQPDSYIIVWADKDLDQAGYHADFKLSASGESIYLADATGNILDSVVFGEQITDATYGRYPNGTGDFRDLVPTFGAENMKSSGIFAVWEDNSAVRIFPNPAYSSFTIERVDGQYDDTVVEIYNMQGSKLYQANINNAHTIATDSWSRGLYLVRVGNTISKISISK